MLDTMRSTTTAVPNASRAGKRTVGMHDNDNDSDVRECGLEFIDVAAPELAGFGQRIGGVSLIVGVSRILRR